MSIFLLTPFDTWDCCYFKSNLNPGLLIEVFLTKKHVMLFCSILNMKIWLSLLSLFLFLSRISLGRYCQNNVVKRGEFGKKDKKEGEGWPYSGGGVVCRRGDSNLHTMPVVWNALRIVNVTMIQKPVTWFVVQVS